MGRYLKQYDKDYMKMAMLKQEETFKQQVHELHRLYGVQKLLMNNMESELKKHRKSSYNWNNETDSYSQDKRTNHHKLDLNIRKDDDDESGLELTLSIGNSRRRKNEKSFSSDSTASFSSSSTDNARFGSYRSDTKSKFDVGELKQSPWLFQCLKPFGSKASQSATFILS